MSNYQIKLNLTKVRGAFAATISGKSASKKCVCIPLDECFVADSGAVYLDFSMWRNREPGRYGDTHAVKQQFRKEIREMLTEDERRTYCGNARPIERQEAQSNEAAVQAPSVQVQADDDLPF